MGCLCNTSLSIKLPSPLQGKVKWISTNHNAMPALSQGPLLLLISPSQHGHQSPKRNFGRPGAPGAGALGSPQCLLVPYSTKAAVPAAGSHPKPCIPLLLPGLGPSRGLWVHCWPQLLFPVTLAMWQGREEGTLSSFLSFTPQAQPFPHRSKGAAKMQPATTPSFAPLPFYFTSPNGVGGTEQSPALFKGLILEPSMLGSNACLAALRGVRSTTVTIPPQGLAHPGISQTLTKTSPGQLP